MIEQITSAVINHAADAVVFGLASCMVILWKKLNALLEGLQSMLQMSLIQTNEKCVREGYITLYERQNFDKRYNSYKTLGADGVIDTLVEEVQKLPIKARE